MTLLPPPKKRPKPDFIMPMINIVFLMLLFFMTTGSLSSRDEANTHVSVTRTLPLERLPRPLLLMEPDGALSIDGKPVDRADLAARARAAIAATGGSEPSLHVLSPREMPASAFLPVASILRQAGIAVTIVTLHDREGAAGR
jgi:biopolymer transport protein ExbD